MCCIENHPYVLSIVSINMMGLLYPKKAIQLKDGIKKKKAIPICAYTSVPPMWNLKMLGTGKIFQSTPHIGLRMETEFLMLRALCKSYWPKSWQQTKCWQHKPVLTLHGFVSWKKHQAKKHVPSYDPLWKGHSTAWRAQDQSGRWANRRAVWVQVLSFH